MNENYISPFEEVEKGIRSCDLPSSHLYWDNYVKVSKCFDVLMEQQKLDLYKNNIYMFEREFSKNTTPERVQLRLNKKTIDCYGACSSLNYIMTRPSGIELKLINN